MRRQAWVIGLVMAAGFVFSALSGPSARASEASDFYKGKTLTWIVSTGPGGGHDFYARLIVKHMAKYRIQFGPAPDGNEPSYLVLHRGLSTYLFVLSQPKK